MVFNKGDRITITQKEDGGWWEGTLDGKTGWFPSNYVKQQTLPGNKSSILKYHARPLARDLVVDGGS